MATTKQSGGQKKAPGKSQTRSSPVRAEVPPKFPYTTKPGSLRRLLKEIPKKPKPAKYDKDLLRGWGFSDTNDLNMLRVLKAVSLLNEKNEPSELYSQFMNFNGGAKYLAPEIKRVYEPLFQASFSPYNEDNATLRNLFNIHSGGGERSLEYQVQTFKALCENADFDGAVEVERSQGAPKVNADPHVTVASIQSNSNAPAVHINLHIHLPENKSRRDYEDIIEDIGRYIFGRGESNGRE